MLVIYQHCKERKYLKKIGKMFLRIQDLETDLQEKIKKIITQKGYVQFDLKITDLNTGGDNFLGNLYEIDIKGDTGNEKTETNLFVKVIIKLEKIKLVCVEDVYRNEMFLYNDLSKIFKVLQDEAKIPIKERYNMVKSFDETNSHVIILENLSKNGFKTYSRFEVMPLKFAELSVQQLAKFHGMSFAMENKMPVFYNSKIKTIKHLANYNDDFEAMVLKNSRYIADLFENEKKRRVDKFIPTIFEKFTKYNTDTSTVTCCLTHGDYKVTNVLVRESEGEAVEVVPIDYQLMDYGCPIRDFFFFIFTATDREFRRKHLQDLKEMYFETLTQFLRYFEIDVEDVYPKKEFERVYSEWLEFGLMKFMFGAVFLYASENGLDVENLSLSELPFNPSSDFVERAGGLVDDFIEWGCL